MVHSMVWCCWCGAAGVVLLEGEEKMRYMLTKRFTMINIALRWALLGLVFSELGNAIFEGSVIPSIIAVGLPVWVIAFRKTFGLIIDFCSPAAGWIVDKFGGFSSLAGTEGLEGVLCLAVALVPTSWEYWKWSLVFLGCALLCTGQVIDVASEVFEVEAAEDDDDMLVQYSGLVGIILSITGELLGNVIGSALTQVSVPVVLFVSSALSFACFATRFATKGVIMRDIAQHDRAHAEVERAQADAAEASIESNDGAQASTNFAAEQLTAQKSVADKGTADNNTANASTANTNTADSNTVIAALTTNKTKSIPLSSKIRLALSTCLLTASSAVWMSYFIFGIGQTHGLDTVTVLYAISGVAGVLGSLIYARVASPWGMRRTAMVGIVGTIAGIAVIAFGQLSLGQFAIIAIGFGWFIQGLADNLLVHPIIVSRQLLLAHDGLAKFSGYARFMAASGAALGTWIGWSLSAYWQFLPFLGLALTPLFFLLVGVFPESTKNGSTRKLGAQRH